MSVFHEVQKLPEYKGLIINSYFFISARFFGRDCKLLYKIIGFNPIEDMVYANKRNKRTLRIKNHSPILEGFKYSDVINYKDIQ